ncbi:MAG: hypothetical protein B6V02_02295 [Thermoprotei archaeon ex4572_64]|nr:MAG: hypothetical protein B6V02_02295 [Thermoprotei archaeon ex4572_64]
MFKCSICGKPIEFRDVKYIYENVIVCRECYPQYYVRKLCPLVRKRMLNKNPTSCIYCNFKKECDEYLLSVVKKHE